MYPRVFALGCLGLAALLSVRPLGAQGLPDPVADLPALLAALYADNPSLAAARLDAEAATWQGAQARALPDPAVSVVYQPLPVFTARGTQRSQWRVEQAVPYPGKRALREAIADLGAEVQAYEADALALDLALDLVSTYAALYGLQAQQRLLDDHQRDLATFAEAATTQYAVGQGMQQAILKAQLEKNALVQRALALDIRRQSARERLAQLLNRDPFGALDVGALDAASLAPPPRLVLPADTLGRTALLDRLPEMQALRAARARADQHAALVEKAFRPDFAFSLTYFDIATASVPLNADGRDALAIGAGMKVPLWRTPRRAAREEARLDARRLDARLDALESQIRYAVRAHAARLALEQQTLDLYHTTLLPQAELTREATLSAYTTGRTDFLDLLDAVRTLFTLREQAIETEVRRYQSAAALARALGGFAFEDHPAFR